MEAVNRWDSGVRVRSTEGIERKYIGNSPYVVFEGTSERVHGMYAFLTSEPFNEDRVRYILLDITLGGPISYYRNFPNDPNSMEAVNRWDSGVRVRSTEGIERKYIGNSPYVVFKGTNERVHGMYAFLTSEPFNEARVRYILLDIALGGPISYYRSFPNDPNAMEAVNRWDSGVRVKSTEGFERKFVLNTWLIIFSGTEHERVHGMCVPLTESTSILNNPTHLNGKVYCLNQNYPNPFNLETTIEFVLL